MANKGKNNSITEMEFYSQIAEQANHIPVEVVREVYGAMLRVMATQFKAGRDLTFPGIGKLYAVMHAPKRHHNINTMEYDVLPAKRIIHFTAALSLKKYINAIEVKD